MRRPPVVVESGIASGKEIYFGVNPMDVKEALHAVVGGVSGTGAAVPDCLACGGCCAWSETWPVLMGERDGEGIPEDLIDADHRRMRSWGHRCAALEGELGLRVGCSVYAHRPLVCREFRAGSEDCLMVRRKFGFEATGEE